VEELGGEPSFPVVTVGSVKICNVLQFKQRRGLRRFLRALHISIIRRGDVRCINVLMGRFIHIREDITPRGPNTFCQLSNFSLPK
jgi:hypothetical protein